MAYIKQGSVRQILKAVAAITILSEPRDIYKAAARNFSLNRL